ncbi:MAG: hypothetical protein ACK4UX_00735 [Thiobacillus sp.]
MRAAVCLGLLGLMASVAVAADYRAGPDTYRDLLPRLQAGDRLLLEPGDYYRGLPLHRLTGMADAPIVVEAADPTRPPRLVARAGAHTVSLVDVRHVTVRHLELDGRNLPVDAVRAEGHSRYADHVTLEHLHIHDHAASQQNVGISTKCPAFGWVVRNNRIERVGTGMYFGDSDGSDAFVAALIEGNQVTATLGYSLQIKHQKARAPGVVGRHDTVIRFNVFDKHHAQPWPLARPNVLLGHFPLDGEGREDRYLVQGNRFLHNPSEALFQAEGRVALYDNVFVNDYGDAIRIQPHNDVPRTMLIFSNTVLASGVGIQVRQPEGSPYRQRVVGNLVAASIPLRGGEAAHNLALAYRAEWAEIPEGRLTDALLATASPVALPEDITRELGAYPGWATRTSVGARLTPGPFDAR